MSEVLFAPAVLAEPEDLVIMCGEFNSGVQIISQSEEPDQVFNVKKIVNYPHYNPKRVCFAYVCYIQKAAFFQEGIGEGGPYEGNDVCVITWRQTFSWEMT